MQLDKNTRIITAVLLVAAACVLIVLIAAGLIQGVVLSSIAIAGFLLLIVIAVGFLTGQKLRDLNIGVGKIKMVLRYYESVQLSAQPIELRRLDQKTIEERESFIREIEREHALPGGNAPRFSAIALANAEDLLIRPSAYPMTPMYLLDNAFRIIDWNEAFSIAFDRTMEGHKGRNVSEWTYYLDNFRQVIDHGLAKFSDPNSLPLVDIESIEYTSRRYGKLAAIKRAYQIFDDEEACLGWLVTLDLKFAESSQRTAFQQDLIRVLALDLMWSEYATSYDRVLNATKVYPELLDKVAGGYDGVRAIPEDARVIDLGAGTGNLALKLIKESPDRAIYAAENNRIMLEFLRTKCKRYERRNGEGGGVIAFKQDITSLFGLDDNYFDFAIMNNVLYAVQDHESCLKEALRVLKPGGELRLSGPRSDTKLEILFNRIMKDLKDVGKFTELEADYRTVLQINELKLRPMLHRWSTQQVREMLLNIGFSEVVHASEDAYAGQSMLVCAVK